MKKLLAVLLATTTIVGGMTACTQAPATDEGASTEGGASETANADYIVLEEGLASEEYAIGFRQADYALAQEVQGILDEMATEGITADISKEWFGTDLFINDREYPREVTPDSDGDLSLTAIQEKGILVMGLDDNFPPMGFRDDENNIVGFDVDLAEEVCERLGVELQLQPIDWDAKELELSSGNIDCIWNGMTVTDERATNMYLSKPYLDNRQVLIVAADSGIETLADLEGKIIGLQKGSSARVAYDSSSLVDTTEVQEYVDNVSVYLDLQAGRVDAFLVDEVAGNYIIANQGV